MPADEDVVIISSLNHLQCLITSLAVQIAAHLHAVEVLRMLHHHAVSQDQQTANGSCLTGVVRGERGGGVSHRSQNSYGTGRRNKQKKTGEEEKERDGGRRERGQKQREEPCRVQPNNQNMHEE